MLFSSSLSLAGNLRIGVLGLFHPTELTVRPTSATTLIFEGAGRRITIREGNEAHLRAVEGRVRCTSGEYVLAASLVRVGSRQGRPTTFILSVPGRIARQYRGDLEVSVLGGVLVPVVLLDVEVAVASAVAAESPPGAPLEALKAQAVVTRSYYLAARRHPEFDFCDTTHCQFLREPPAADLPAWTAAASTFGLVLAYHGEITPALFSASCGGRTRSLSDAGLTPQNYPYYSVACDYCRRLALRWKTVLNLESPGLLSRPGTEAWRLRIDRKLGWSTVPGNNYQLEATSDALIVRGIGRGHGIGLCQMGAAGMAADGKPFQQILDHYFPNTSLDVVGSAEESDRNCSFQ
jgi:stage II sporulation protein D (peptidoglycan lytic transglycosylase)